MLQIRVLGGLALVAGGEPRPLPQTARGRALLAFCALHPGPHPRARLAAALRPDVLDRSARATLRQAIWALRHAVGERGEAAILAGRDRFGLREDALWVDLLELRRRARGGDVGGALELAAGELLPELDDEWAHAARGAHHDEVGELLARRAEAAAAAGDVDGAIAGARRALEHDPLSERAARALMARFAEAGDRPAALAAYALLGERLRRELGVTPSLPTRELAERIRAGSAPVRAAGPPGTAAPRPAPPPPAAPLPLPLPPRLAEPPRSPFPGRDAALHRLLAVWEDIAGGVGTAAMSSDSEHPPQTLDRPGHESEMEQQPRDEMRGYAGSGKLDGKAALITGGDSGIGRAVAVAFAKEGADVAISYLSEHDDARRTAELVEAEGRKAVLLPGDLSDEATARAVVDDAAAQLGHLDVLVNNIAHQKPVESFEEVTSEDWDTTFKTNVYSFFWCSHQAMRHLPDGGAIINTSSINGLRGNKSLIAYSATKGAVNALTYSLAQALNEKGIRVNAVAPGPVWTPLIPATMDEEKVESFGQQSPMGRAAQPDEIAPSFVFFASGQLSSYYSGEILAPIGGETLPG